jgi:hypothetical protein
MSKEQLLQELAEAFEQLIGTATEAAQRGVTRQGDTWGPREIVAHLAGWEVMATVRIPKIAACMEVAHLASPQTVFEIVVDNEIEFLISKPVVLCQYTVYFVNNCFGFPRKYTLYCKHPSILKAHSSHFRMDVQFLAK